MWSWFIAHNGGWLLIALVIAVLARLTMCVLDAVMSFWAHFLDRLTAK